MISSYPPRACGIATFAEEAREFIRRHNPDRDVLVISHLDGDGDGVLPLIDITKRAWWYPVVKAIEQIQPWVIHIQHEYGLYEYNDERGQGDNNHGFLDMLAALSDFPVIVEPHTIHGRMRDLEADFVYKLCSRADLVLFKCHYQKWRLAWNFEGRGWPVPQNVMVVPHGARPDKRYAISEIPALRQELGVNGDGIGNHLVGLVGWIQNNKRWDILTSMWEEICEEILRSTGEEWDLLAAGNMRDPAHRPDYEKYVSELRLLEKKGYAKFYEFTPRGDTYYKVMAICDFVVLPSVDETQSGTLARIIALNKPFVTTAPLEGLTAQALESGGGLLFTNRKMLKEQVLKLACDEGLRIQLGSNLERYLNEVVSWDVVAGQYYEAYELARRAVVDKVPVAIAPEF
jgi:1,2-diacylglycerol 3-alpha-glucosyltransferase